MAKSSLNWTNITQLVKDIKTAPDDIVVVDEDEDDTESVKVKIVVKSDTDEASISGESVVSGSSDGSDSGNSGDSGDGSDGDEEVIFKRYNSRRKRVIKKEGVKKRSRDHCVNCGENSVIYDDGAFVCTDCGVVQGALYSTEAETRYYGNDDNKKGDPSRTGAPVNELLPTASLMPVIGGYGREKFREIHKRYSMKYDERSLYNMINKTKTRLKNSGIPVCIVDKAIVYYKLLGEENFKLRAAGDNFMAACILYMCKKKGIIKTNQEIADIFGIKGKNMTKGVACFQELIFRYNPELMDIVKPVTPEDFIKRYCTDLRLRFGIMKEACHVAEVASQLGLTKHNMPSSTAVGCIFLISQTYGYGLTKTDIFRKSNISDVTINNCYRKLLPHKNYLLNKESLKDLDEVVDDSGVGIGGEGGGSEAKKQKIILDMLKD